MARRDAKIPPSKDRWYYLEPGADQPVGPLSLDQLQTLVEDKLLAKGTKVWRRGMFLWAEISQVKQLKVPSSLFRLAFPFLRRSGRKNQPPADQPHLKL
jgi:hypothetical protein